MIVSHSPKVYAQPVEYWKNYYNLFDFAILVVSLIHEILQGVDLGGSGVTFLRMAGGKSFSSIYQREKNSIYTYPKLNITFIFSSCSTASYEDTSIHILPEGTTSPGHSSHSNIP